MPSQRSTLPDLDDAKKRKPIPIENIKEIQQECMSIDDEARWLVALISDTGMRLSEAAGLHVGVSSPNFLYQYFLISLLVFQVLEVAYSDRDAA